jgi:hypothetical protein
MRYQELTLPRSRLALRNMSWKDTTSARSLVEGRSPVYQLIKFPLAQERSIRTVIATSTQFVTPPLLRRGVEVDSPLSEARSITPPRSISFAINQGSGLNITPLRNRRGSRRGREGGQE